MLTADLFANFIVVVVFLSALGVLGGSLSFGIFLLLSLVAIAFVSPWLLRPKDASSKPSEHTGTTAAAGLTRRSLRRPGLGSEARLTEGATS